MFGSLAFSVSPSCAFELAGRWETTASGATGVRGTPVVLTWSVVPDGTEIRDRGTSDLIATLDQHFDVTNPTADLTERPWFRVVESCFDRWSELGGLTFVYEPRDDGAMHRQEVGEFGVRGDVRLAGTSIDGLVGTLATAQLPDGGDVTIDTDGGSYLLSPANDYRRLRNTLMHEIGHAFGLDHLDASDANLLMEATSSVAFDGPQLDDVRALHQLYGDRLEGRSGSFGNDTFADATHLGQIESETPYLIGGEPRLGQQVDPSDNDFLSISSRFDRDVFAFTVGSPGEIDVTLTPLGGGFHALQPSGDYLLVNAEKSTNLYFDVWDSMSNRLAQVNDGLHGATEQIIALPIDSEGTYYLQIDGTRDDVQLYSLAIEFRSRFAVPELSSFYLVSVFFLATLATNGRLKSFPRCISR